MALRQERLLRRMAWHTHAGRWIPKPSDPSRIVLAVIIAAFSLSMVTIQQTQTAVRLGGEIQQLEIALEAVELERQNMLAETAALNDLTTVQRTAFTTLEMRQPSNPLFTRSQPLPPGVSFDLPLWAAPTQLLDDPPWWERLLRRIGEKVTRLAE